MTDVEVTLFDDSKLIHTMLQILGLAPYSCGSTGCIRLSKILVVYNIVLAALVTINAWFAQTDDANNPMYANKTFIVDTAFDLVDWFGVIYVTITVICSITRRKVGNVFYKITCIDQKFKTIGIIFDKKKRRNYFVAKMATFITVAILVLIIHAYLEESSGNHYTKFYWLCVLHPMLVSSVVSLLFGTFALNLYEKFWVINELLRTVMADYLAKKDKKMSVRIPPQLLNYERLQEEIILAQAIKYRGNFLDEKPKEIQPVPVIKRQKPHGVFVANFPRCFEKKISNCLKEVQVLREIYMELLDLGYAVNEFFGPHFLLLFVWYFLGVVIYVYAVVSFHVNWEFDSEYGSSVVRTLSYSVLVLYNTIFSNIVTGEVRIVGETHFLISYCRHDKLAMTYIAETCF